MTSGWLTKEGGSYKNWKRRYMVIEGTDLAYYKKDNKKERCGAIPLVGASVVSTNYKSKKFCFEVSAPGNPRAYHICAETDEDLARWLKALNEIALGQNPTTPSPSSSVVGEKKVGLVDFSIRNVIGQGSFGKVLLVTKKEDPHKGKVFAMKVLNKSTVIARNEVEHTKSEKSILMKLEHPFLVNLFYSFQTPDKLYLIMDYINGGELFFHLQKDKCFTEERVRFYAAEIASGLEYLHASGVIYRDLKPENLLLSREGHIIMTDFGLSKEGLIYKDDRTSTFCGTPEYLAPEVLEGKGYGKAVDWWSFGTLLYEMMTGLPPFYSDDVQDMYTKIMTAQLKFPSTMSPDAVDLLTRFLDRNDATRLQEPSQIRAHPFFKPINWDLLIQKKLTPPFKPEVSADDDIGNIDRSFTEAPIDLDDDTGPIPATAQGEFEGFTYTPNAPKKEN